MFGIFSLENRIYASFDCLKFIYNFNLYTKYNVTSFFPGTEFLDKKIIIIQLKVDEGEKKEKKGSSDRFCQTHTR